ncbi:MAG: hypothetical protein PHU44_12930 [Syntrophales bacterium]|nr:hypothetical protein [Syntrophales bacterium]MDD5642119.1 hypothetical protein [Syntrophales bacterium]
MKEEPNIKVVTGQGASGTQARRLKKLTTPPPLEVMSLISLENQEASRLDLHSFEEAQGLLEKLLFQVEEVKGALEEVHQLQERCLVRLW